MSVIERFTRDKASKFVWAATALAAALGLVYAIVGGGRAVEAERASSHARAVRYVEVLDRRLDTRDLASPLTRTLSESLGRVVRRSILADERVSRVRIWSTDGTLLFSTDPSDRRGSDEGLNDPVLRAASREGPLTRTDLSDGGGADDPERTLLRTYVPLGTASVAEIDQTDAGTVALPRTTWFSYQLLAAGVLVLLLVMTAISLRDPIDPINTGVPFAASSVPQGFSLVDDDRLAEVEEVHRLASERVARVQEKLDESEEARRQLESYIQQSLSIGSAPSPAASAAGAPAAQAPPALPAVVQVPESDVLPTAALDEAFASAPADPLTRASDAQEAPTASLQQKPLAEKPKRLPKRRRAKSEQQTSAPTEVSEMRPEPVPEPGPEPEADRGVAASAASAAAPAAPAVDEATWKQEATMKSGHGEPHEWHPLCDVLGCEHAEGPEEREEVPTSRPGPKGPRRQAASPPATAPVKVPATGPPVPAKRQPRRKAPGSAPRGGATPTPQPAAPPRSEIDDANAHAAALETFIRLTESDRQHHEETDPADQSEMRAALARTAARKKPGGERLQPHDVTEESLGGPPKGREQT